MVHPGGLDIWDPRKWKGLLLTGIPRIPNHQAPNQQLTISWTLEMSGKCNGSILPWMVDVWWQMEVNITHISPYAPLVEYRISVKPLVLVQKNCPWSASVKAAQRTEMAALLKGTWTWSSAVLGRSPNGIYSYSVTNITHMSKESPWKRTKLKYIYFFD